MAVLNRWITINTTDLAQNLVNVVDSNISSLQEHPFKRGSIWRKASKNLGRRFDTDKDAFRYYAAFHGDSNVAELFCNSTGYLLKDVSLKKDVNSCKRYCICGILEESGEASSATSPMLKCSSCSEWYHSVCLNASPKKTTLEWHCPACTGKDTASFVPKVFLSSYLKRKQIKTGNEKADVELGAEKVGEPKPRSASQFFHRKPKKQEKDERLFESVLLLMKKDLSSTDSWKQKEIPELATSFSAWGKYVRALSSNFHAAKTAINNQIKRIYKMQRFAQCHQQVIDTMEFCKIPQSIIMKYVFLWNETFGSGSHKKEVTNTKRVEISTEIKPLNRRRCFNTALRTGLQVTPTQMVTSPNQSKISETIMKKDVLDQQTDEKFKAEIELVQEGICGALGIDKTLLNYSPPSSFEIVLSYNELPNYFDFDKKEFVPKEWGNFINDAIKTAVEIPCSFNARTDPAYSESGCRMYGYCSGECSTTFSVHFGSYPVQGRDWIGNVERTGDFSLFQCHQTGRKVTGFKRSKFKEVLKNGRTSYRVFADEMQKAKPLDLIHQNIPLRSKDVVRKMKSEVIKATRSSQFPDEEIHLTMKQYSTSHNSMADLKGYIQLCNTQEDKLTIYIYDENTLKLHSSLMRQNKVEIRIDATGSICRNRTDKPIFLYLVLSVVDNNLSYPLGMMISETHDQMQIGAFLGQLRYEIINLNSNLYRTQVASIYVCDFSYAMIHSISAGFNRETLMDYLNRSWMVLNNEDVWPDHRSCIFICTSHLIKAVQRNLTKKLLIQDRKQKRKIIELALYATARLIDCESIEDFKMISSQICYVFGKEVVNKIDLDYREKFLKSKPIPVAVDLDKQDDIDPQEMIVKEQLEKTYQPLHDLSPFSVLFKSIWEDTKQLKVDPDTSVINSFYSEPVMKPFEREKVPTWPIWSSALPRLVKDEDFNHLSNAAIESDFKTLKKCYIENDKLQYSDVTKDLVKLYEARRNEVAARLAKTVALTLSKKLPARPELSKEVWKRKPSKRVSKYFSEAPPKKLKLSSDKTEKGNSARKLEMKILNFDTGKTDVTSSQSLSDKICRLPGQIPWAGFFVEGKQIKREMTNTCPFDTPMFILYALFKLSEECKTFFQNSDQNEEISLTFSFDILFGMMDNKEFDKAKSYWLSSCNFSKYPNIMKGFKLNQKRGLVDCWGSEEELFLHHIRPLFKITEKFACTNTTCSGETEIPLLNSSFLCVGGKSAKSSVKQLTSTKSYRRCVDCNEKVIGSNVWHNGIPLPFFPLHGNPGEIVKGKYVAFTTEKDLEQYRTIKFGGLEYQLFAYTVYSNSRAHFFGVFNTSPKIRHDGKHLGDVKCEPHNESSESLAVGTLWYIRAGLLPV